MASQDLFSEVNEDSLGPQFERFRARTQSNLSMPGKSSPHYNEDFEFPSWVNNTNTGNSSLGSQLGPITSNVNEIMDRTDQIRLDCADIGAPDFCSTSNSIKEALQQRQSPLQMTIPSLKQEEIKAS